MPKRKHGYTWPHRTRKAMTEYLAAHQGYWPMNSNNGGFVLAWNVKVYRFDEMGRGADRDYPVQSRFDAQWKMHLEDSPDLFYQCCADAARMYWEKEWTNYPGIEQGEWEFSSNGRSSGYMILKEAPGWLPHPRAFACCAMSWSSRDDYKDWLAELDMPTLKRFYRAIRVLDRDLRTEACEDEVSYQFGFARFVWEQDLIEAEERAARQQEADRPDLYQGKNAA